MFQKQTFFCIRTIFHKASRFTPKWTQTQDTHRGRQVKRQKVNLMLINKVQNQKKASVRQAKESPRKKTKGQTRKPQGTNHGHRQHTRIREQAQEHRITDEPTKIKGMCPQDVPFSCVPFIVYVGNHAFWEKSIVSPEIGVSRCSLVICIRLNSGYFM